MSNISRLKGRAVAPVSTEEDNAADLLAGDAQKRGYHRIPWSGNLDETELRRPGGTLLAALITCANERRLQMNTMAEELGVTYGYVNQLRNGIRTVAQISDSFALECAIFLGIPRLTVLAMAGRITKEDAYEDRQMLATEIQRAMAYIAADPKWAPYLTVGLKSMDSESLFMLVTLYEKAEDKVLLPKAVNLASLMEELSKLEAVKAQRNATKLAYASNKVESVEA